MKVKVVTDIHLDPAHKALLILDAPSAEFARDYLAMAKYGTLFASDFHFCNPLTFCA